MPTIAVSPIDCVILHPSIATKLDDIRDIVEAVKYRPAESGQKVLVIQYPERLSPGGQNALRKVLEDVPEHLTVIIATADSTWKA